ncbi:MAG: hypothetical protein JWN21_810 [Sphingomonas bacterium]|uniref:SPOR domain-containing protein n=1 Tax=Sphingomonas bacterium TaxID=1895847 RepID=UPI0026131966|nr:SPOR domain-containing protein [Sphingomonas bacterium]MDB5695267.1 hypothetical protein [Sphingomonas bacterium]
MNPKLAKLGLIGLAYGGIMVMTATDAPRGVGRERVSAEAREAAKHAGKAFKALSRGEADTAIVAAEQAVAFAPRVADYRMLLGQGYLKAGRFASAGQAFADVLQLEPSNGKAALNLALTQIAGGDWQAARATLTQHSDTIPASDRGLGMALAGDTAGAVALLTTVARSPGATAKIRQNLALTYALAGQWQIARVVATADMSPADVDARLEQWAVFAQPRSATDQVASLLGVQPVADRGQPTALALNAPVMSDAPVAVAAVVAPVAPPVPVEVSAAAPMQIAAVQDVPPAVRFGPRREVVQVLTAALIASPTGPIKVAAKPPTANAVKPVAPRLAKVATGTGDWHVQLGAFESAGVAKDAWGRAQRRFDRFKGSTPSGMTFKTQSASFYRLSVGGFSHAGAAAACRQYRTLGGACFIRPGAGDQMASWLKPKGTQLAMR